MKKEYTNKYKKLLDLIYDYIAEEDFDKVRSLLSIYGFDSVEELEDFVKILDEFELKCSIITKVIDAYKEENK